MKIRIYLINTGPKTSKLKTFEIIPSLQLAWWKKGGNIGVFWLNFGLQLGFGVKFEDSLKKKS